MHIMPLSKSQVSDTVNKFLVNNSWLEAQSKSLMAAAVLINLTDVKFNLIMINIR